MNADPQPTSPATDTDIDDALDTGRSAPAPAEGGDDVDAPDPGSPAG